MVGVPVLDHCQDYNLVGNGVVHEGYWSTLLGLPGWPAAGEEAIVMRNILLAELCDHPIHCQHITHRRKCAIASRSAGARRKNKRRGLSASHRANRRSDPKFRYELQSESAAALAEQTLMRCWKESPMERLSILCSDHAPHARFRKGSRVRRRAISASLDWRRSSAYFIDLLVHKHRKIDIARLIEIAPVEPARLLKLDAGTSVDRRAR